MPSELRRLAHNLVRGAFLELYLTPKPGLVDLNDPGSHHDLSLERMEASLEVVSGYLCRLADSLARGEELAAQVRLGMEAEKAMLERAGTNCHKGYIFLSGLLLAAAARSRGGGEEALSEAVAGIAARLFDGAREESNGSRACTSYGARGIRGEALEGLPALFREALPAFRRELAAGNRGSAVYAMLGRLMATVEDTTALHRCGSEGLRTVKEDGRALELLVERRDDFMSFLSRRNEHYVSRNLTMGGVADLLALSFAWLSHTGELEIAPQ
ncbi:triphosphoribosyl-dephospho-CoA synthase [Geomonas subterranea]|uniref:triphosphoribosyl-dephospho-CoA synthase n=1 Tax=Geomonas subterranea TaxID=2847989 RepID=A0ABX8LE14_9BACT|nr:MULTISPECIES: triphosphoribosyl-dephospho-CoA synthase [Geomonas]QXE90247.1 triphosphoribosyl-dephospho-CoA synthase [Geomonas subterranea]QXM07627.1 triphosphoribosyl-dephospho-CoA synthase [Geomonas subterranea]